MDAGVFRALSDSFDRFLRWLPFIVCVCVLGLIGLGYMIGWFVHTQLF